MNKTVLIVFGVGLIVAAGVGYAVVHFDKPSLPAYMPQYNPQPQTSNYGPWLDAGVNIAGQIAGAFKNWGNSGSGGYDQSNATFGSGDDSTTFIPDNRSDTYNAENGDYGPWLV